MFGDSNKTEINTANNYKSGYGVTTFYAANFGDFGMKFNAGYTYDKHDRNAYDTDTVTGQKDRAWRVATNFSFGPASVGVEYGRTDHRLAETTFERTRAFLVGAKVQVMEPASVYFQYQNNQDKTVATGLKETENRYIVGADYKFNKNVRVYSELARSLTKVHTAPVEKSNDTMYGVGLRVYF